MTATIPYRLYTFDVDGHIASARILECRGDSEAVSQSTRLVEDHALELWCGAKFIGRFEPKKVERAAR